jgi:hypothetical protein
MSIRTLNGLPSNTININTISAGEGISLVNNNTTLQSVNVDISKQSAKETLVNTDVFVLEEADGSVKKVTYQNLIKDVDSNFWNETGDVLRPVNATSSVLVGGTSMNNNSFKFQVDGNSYVNGNLLVGTASNTSNRKVIVIGDSEFGDVYIPTDKKLISTSDVNDYLKFGDGTFTCNYSSNVITNSISFGTTADLNLATGRAITRGTDSKDRITFNSGNCTFGNIGIFNNGVYVKSTDGTNSGSVSFFEASDNGPNNIDLHSPLLLTHDYNVYLPKITDTSLLNVYLLSNKNVLQGTNINISNSGTDTITVNMDTTINGTITFTSTISGSVSGNAGTATKIASITNSNIVQLTNSQVLTNKTLSTGCIWNGNTIGVAYGGTGITSYTIGDLIYGSSLSPTTLSKLAIGSSNSFLMSNGTNPVWNTLTFTEPLKMNGTTINLGNLSGFGSNNQLLATNGTNALEYRTLTEGTNITITNTSGAITISSSENYWKRNSNISSFDIETTNTVDNIVLTVPLSTNNTFTTSGTFTTSNTFVSTSSIKSTLGLISGGGEYIKFIDYSGTKPLELKGIINSSTQRTYHMAFKNDYTGTSYPLLGQDINGNLFFHWNALGDKFTFKSNGDSIFTGNISALTSSNITTQTGDFGNAHSKFTYTNPYTWLYDPSGTNGAASFAGAYLGWHNNGSAIYLNTPAAGTSVGDYIGFATGNVPKGRMEMTGNFKITGSLTTGHTFCDERVKENINDYDTNAVELLKKLQIKSFDRKTFDNFNSDENGILLPFAERFSDETYPDIGLIAQDVLKIPELEFLVDNQDGGDIEPMAIPDWSPLTAICIKAIQEMDTIIKQQQAVIDKLVNSKTFKDFKS